MSTSKTSIGRSLIKTRVPNQQRRAKVGDDWIHYKADFTATTDWNRLNLRSITDQNSLDDFLTTAQLAGTDFAAERLNVTFIPPVAKVGILSAEDKERIKQAQDLHKERLQIPRRPPWTTQMETEQIERQERESFLDWRRKLALLQEIDDITLTPFEKNLEFWRQLWRVIEKSDIIVQIVDARNPLLFRCEDLETYVHELSSEDKLNVILVNKSDLLTDEQRELWAKYFDTLKLRVIFYSALQTAPCKPKRTISINENDIDDTEKILNEIKRMQMKSLPDDNMEITTSVQNPNNRFNGLEVYDSENTEKDESEKIIYNNDDDDDVNNEDDNITDEEKEYESNNETSENEEDSYIEPIRPEVTSYEQTKMKHNLSLIVNREELIYLLKSFHKNKKTVRENILTIGMVGYPNVGKSSTINSLLQYKKVSVSATPGKTKHFQTIFLDKNLLLCDCPGLVFPSFVSTKDELIINGILPIDQMRDYIGPQIPRSTLSGVYNIMLPLPNEGEDEDRPPTSIELCSTYAYSRGFMTHKGIPDGSRAARILLKDYVQGKLLFCYPPPGQDANDFQHHMSDDEDDVEANEDNEITSDGLVKAKVKPSTVDQEFFHPVVAGFGTKSISGRNKTNEPTTNDEKPWKKHNKYHNRNKHEKLRRVFKHLDA
ncbi:unnamed protein product [Didymodactylos carnosus]|uniref:Large subunit GTPase 1 homolog n=1 Tax=Didymodactylos carnosus TaxID=1234261 RepID=A0A813SC40_9BILA|nr:unnamed protein product [Didymodactylos carnosus]CAF0852074.1 unnamed protein product [Didymodactylos carnosus]CAF3577395.1 unnamed protein product [Didymodactylos carnosus]CAF3637278.1 unnamed protein product [Didymodactylos carnosus]